MSKVSPENWQQVRDLFDAASARPVEERAKFLDRACAGDKALRRQVESLLGVQARLSAGRQISHYKIERWLGQGGMGEVYLAHDSKLDRMIALKLLPVDFASDENRVRRFQQEARAASALNHPNVCMIHEIGKTDDGRQYITMEHVAGVTLRQQMATYPLKLAQALDIATQVAAALAPAHGAGIVHRDIKPENVMVRNDGLIKVLDFGLAKRTTTPAVVDDRASTKMLVHTEPGMVMGTVAYMSPEQARGLEIDARTDIWSLGVLLYEMVTGKLAFAGATSSDLLVSILDREPLPLSRYLPDVPAELQRIVSKALRKDKEERYQVVKDLFLDLKSLKQELEFEARLQYSAPPELSSGETGSGEITCEIANQAGHNVGQQTKEVQKARTTLSAGLPNRKPLFWTAGILGGLLLIAVGAWYLSRLMTKPGPTQPALTAVPLTTDPGFEGMPSLSPDGSQVAFASGGPQTDNFDIYVKQIGGGPPRRLTADPAVDNFPAWSPDGRSIAFIRERGDRVEVILIPSLGGTERKLTEAAALIFPWTPPYLSWSADSRYMVTMDRASPGEPLSLFVLSIATGEKRRLTTPPATALADGNPSVSPDGRTLAFVRIVSAGNPQLYVLPLSEDYKSAGEERHLDLAQPSVVSPAWTADGQEIICFAGQRFGRDGRLWRVPVSGSEKPQPLVSVGETASQPTISRQGNRLVYAQRTAESVDIWRVEVSGTGRSSPPVNLIASTRDDSHPMYSPDGSRIVFASKRSGPAELWVSNEDGSNPAQLTSLESTSGSPRWFPDGRRVVFDSDKEENVEIYLIDIATLVPRRLTNEPSDDVTPSVSRDGKWIYFSSKRTGRLEVWRMPAEGGEAVQVTRHGGDNPFESLDGKVVYYRKDLDVWKVPVAAGEESKVLGPIAGAFAVRADGIYFNEPGTPGFAGLIKGQSLWFFSFTKGTAEKVFDSKYWPAWGLSVSPDGRYVLFAQRDPVGQDLMLVENFR